MMSRRIAGLMIVSFLGTGCFGRRGGFGGLLEAAVVTAVIVSALEPPAPRVVIVPAPREGYAWQPGYWTRQDDQWFWVDGSWVAQRPQQQWVPTHWEQSNDGSWRLIQGQWVAGY
jgi:hypothetical protein